MPGLQDVVFGGVLPPQQVNVEISLDGGQSETPDLDQIIEEVAGILSGTTQLVPGQAYVDVAFGSEQPTINWIFIGATIFNGTDPNPLNVWPGVLTSKSTSGFRLQLNGTADTINYFLNWSIKGVFGYYLSGPSSGDIGVASTPFTVRLPDESTLTGTAVITPHDGGAGGTFTPTTVELTLLAPSATFTYTPDFGGANVIGTSNNRGMVNPPQIAYNVVAPTYTLVGPSSGNVGVESADFTVEMSGTIGGTVIITPDDSGQSGTFSPTAVSLSNGVPIGTFTYTPASGGIKTIGTTNDRGLTNPVSLSYESIAPLVDGDPISRWLDSSGNGHDGTQTGAARPIFKTNITNGLPVVRLSSSGTAQSLNLVIPITGSAPWEHIIVMKPANPTTTRLLSLCNDILFFSNPVAYGHNTDGSIYFSNETDLVSVGDPTGGTSFAVIDVVAIASGNNFYCAVNGIGQPIIPITSTDPADFAVLCIGDGDIAEMIQYDNEIASGDRTGIWGYLEDKYGITVTGSTAPVAPDSVTGLVGWWKADSL